MEINPINKTYFNLAGIIPVAGQPLDFDFPWHDCLQPIGKNYLAVERSVLECAAAGCDSIWVVCPKDMQPLIRHRLGDYIIDPYVYYRAYKFAKYPLAKEIGIYYVCTHPRDYNRRESLPWSIITGANQAYWVGRKLSRWTCPDKYFVSFPYGVISSYYLSDCRAKIRNEKPFYATVEGKSYRDGLYLPFTFDGEDFIKSRAKFRKKETRKYLSDGIQRVKSSEAYTGRYFTHDYVFDKVKCSDANTLEMPWYYDISSWDGLRKWLASDQTLDRPNDLIFSYNEWNPIGGYGEENNSEEAP